MVETRDAQDQHQFWFCLSLVVGIKSVCLFDDQLFWGFRGSGLSKNCVHLEMDVGKFWCQIMSGFI